MYNILVVDDDKEIVESIEIYLGYVSYLRDRYDIKTTTP